MIYCWKTRSGHKLLRFDGGDIAGIAGQPLPLSSAHCKHNSHIPSIGWLIRQAQSHHDESGNILASKLHIDT